MPDRARRYSRKREAIRQALLSTREHPCAEQLYESLKEKMPELSLATVYRNLSEMKQNGEVQSVAYFAGRERFDAVTGEHAHFMCERCGAISDVPAHTLGKRLNAAAQKLVDGSISSHSLIFFGTCGKCTANAQNERAGAESD